MGGLKLPLVLVVTFCSAENEKPEVAPTPSSVSISASSTSTWSLQSPTPPWGSRSGHSFSATANNTVFIIGGYGLLSSLSSSTPPTRVSNPPLMSPLIDVWSSSDLVTWSIQTANASFGSRIDGAVAAGVFVDEVTSSEYTLLLITGGRRPAGGGGAGGGPLGKLLNDCYASVDNGATWVLKSGGSLGSAYSLPAVYGHSLVYFGDNNKFVSLGGFTPRAISDVYYTKDGGAMWDANPQKTWAPRAFMSAEVYNSNIYICGGTDLKQSFSDMYIGNRVAESFVWRQAGALQSPWGSRDSAALLIAQDVLWIIGGRLGAIDPVTGVSIASDVWRSSSLTPVNPSSTQWELVEENSVFGPRFGMGAVALTSTPSSLTSSSNVTLFIFGGLSAQLSPGSQFSPIPVSDVWKSSYNLFCENASVVCNGHGSCPSQGMNKPLSTTMTTSSLPSKHKIIDATTITYTGGLPPLPVTCDCGETGYTGSRCEELVCNSKTCVHGKCKIATGKVNKSLCDCDDISLWSGPNCNIAVCAPGCLHGSCSLLPGGCRCESGWAGALCNEEAGLLRTVGFFITINAGNSFLTVTLLGVLTVCFAVISVNRAAIGAPSLYELAVSARKTKSLKELVPLLPTSSSSSRSGSGPNTSSTNRGGEQHSLFYVGGGETLYSSSSTSSSSAAASILDKSAGGNSSSGSSGSGDDSSSSLSNLTASERLARKVRAVDGATPLRSDGIMRSRHGEAVAFSPKRRIATVNNNNSTNSLQQSFLTNSEEEGGGGALMMNTPVGQLKDDDRDRDLRHTHSALAILSGGGENGYGASSKRRVRFHAVQEDVRYFDVNDALPILQPLTSPSGPASLRMQQQQQQQQ